jgi:hypothetical protein
MPRPAATPVMSRRLSRGSASGIEMAFRAVRTWGSPRRDARKPSSVGSGSCPRRHGCPLRFASVVGRARNAGSHAAAACAGDCMLTVLLTNAATWGLSAVTDDQFCPNAATIPVQTRIDRRRRLCPSRPSVVESIEHHTGDPDIRRPKEASPARRSTAGPSATRNRIGPATTQPTTGQGCR